MATHPLPVPNDPSLVGIHVYAQAMVADAGGSYLNLLSFTRGLDLTLGL